MSRFTICITQGSNRLNNEVAECDRDIGRGFGIVEWGALFFDVLHCPEPETPIEGENINTRYERRRIKFQQAIPEYPMLGRIWDIYHDASYKSEEVEQLRAECLKIQASTNELRALRGLRELILACDEALKVKRGVILLSD